MSRTGHVVGSCDLLVVADRVDIDRLLVGVVSDVSLSFAGGSADLPRTLVANVTQHSQLTRKYQVPLTRPLFNTRLLASKLLQTFCEEDRLKKLRDSRSLCLARDPRQVVHNYR